MKTIRFLFAVLMIGLTASARADWLWNRQVINGVGTIRTVAYGGGIFVAGTNSGYLLSSRDAVIWTTTRPTTLAINDVVYGHGRFVAAVAQAAGQKSKILYSSDGLTWSYARRVANGGRFGSTDNLSALGTRSGRFIGLGGSSRAFGTSTTGTRWQNPLAGGKPAKYAGSVSGLAVSSNYVLCSTLAGATIQTSSDGFAWTTRFMNASRGPARGLAAEKPGRRVICVGENGLVLTSSNRGLDWRAHPFGSADQLGVAYANKTFVSVTDKMVYSTPAGVTFTRQLRLARSADHLRAVAGGVGLYLAVGNNGRNGLIFVSSGQPGPSTSQ